jgi:hypothetical protein
MKINERKIKLQSRESMLFVCMYLDNASEQQQQAPNVSYSPEHCTSQRSLLVVRRVARREE